MDDVSSYVWFRWGIPKVRSARISNRSSNLFQETVVSSFPSNIHNIRNKTLQTRVSLVSYAELQWANLFLELALTTAKLVQRKKVCRKSSRKKRTDTWKNISQSKYLTILLWFETSSVTGYVTRFIELLCVSVNIFKHTLHLEDRAMQNSGSETSSWQ